MRHLVGLLLFSAGLACAIEPSLAVHLRTSLPSPQPVGTPIGLFPQTEHVGNGMHVVRYSVSVNGGAFRVLRDYSQQPMFAWAPELFEQTAILRVDVRNNETKATAR